ncbi:MAG: hypothetical protein IT270_01815 [Saprospiraceae bacterium]|nr:hypothetical protein [Saprospiraceae bacterium]
MISKEISLFLYGSLILLSGLLLLFLQNASLEWVKYTVAGCFVLAALFAFLTAMKRDKQNVQFAYHEMHALAFIVYAFTVFFFCPSFSRFLYFTAALMLFYTFSEITFSIWLFNLKRKINPRILIVRLALGLLVGIGPVILLAHTSSTKEVKLMSIGLFFSVIGINILLYKPVMKAFQVPHFENQANLNPNVNETASKQETMRY